MNQEQLSGPELNANPKTEVSPEEMRQRYEEMRQRYIEYRKAAYGAMEKRDIAALSQAVEGMYRNAQTEEECLKIFDYLENPDSEFAKLVQNKRKRIRDSGKRAA